LQLAEQERDDLKAINQQQASQLALHDSTKVEDLREQLDDLRAKLSDTQEEHSKLHRQYQRSCWKRNFDVRRLQLWLSGSRKQEQRLKSLLQDQVQQHNSQITSLREQSENTSRPAGDRLQDELQQLHAKVARPVQKPVSSVTVSEASTGENGIDDDMDSGDVKVTLHSVGGSDKASQATGLAVTDGVSSGSESDAAENGTDVSDVGVVDVIVHRSLLG